VIGPVPSGEHSRPDTDREPEDRKHRDIQTFHGVPGWDAVDDQEHDGQEHHQFRYAFGLYLISLASIPLWYLIGNPTRAKITS
jgi:hypothetical protein